jgi:signal transduction histidine kinase
MHGCGFVRNILTSGIGENTDIERGRKVVLLNSISFVGIAMLLILGTVDLFQGQWITSVVDYTFATALTAIVLNFRRSKNYRFTAMWGLSFVGLLFLYLFISGGPDNTGHLWFYTYPLITAFLLGAKRGAYATLILLGAAVIYLAIDPTNAYLAHYSNSFILRFIPSLIVVFASSYLFERMNENAQQKLAQKNIQLEQKITELQQAEAEFSIAKELAEKANHSKSEFLANMSHELRTPLNHIMGFTELVIDETFGSINADQKEYLTNVLTSSRHLLSLINDILDLSKVEAGKMEFEPSSVYIRSVVENCLIMMKEKAMKHGIRLTMEVDEVPENISADARKLKQVLFNILSNAAKFTPDGGAILLKASHLVSNNGHFITPGGKCIELPTNGMKEGNPKQGYILFSVSDTGIGLKPEDTERIFSPFEQGDNAKNRRYQGTGLGLSLSRSLVEMHGGHLWAESEGIGKGSTFSFIIPA